MFYGYNAPNSISAGAPLQTRLGELIVENDALGGEEEGVSSKDDRRDARGVQRSYSSGSSFLNQGATDRQARTLCTSLDIYSGY